MFICCKAINEVKIIIHTFAIVGKIFEFVVDFIAFAAKFPRYIPIANIIIQRIIFTEKLII
jgi:hypothetical protein